MIKRFILTYSHQLIHIAFEEIVQFLFGSIPTPIGTVLRSVFYKTILRSRGLLFVWPRVSLQHTYGLTFGKNCSINCGAVIDARGGISIGDNVMIGPNVVIASSSHDLTGNPMNSMPHIKKATEIGDDVWIGANSFIGGGVKIASGTVVAAGSVVIKDTNPFEVVAGVPAVRIKMRTIQNG